MATPMRSDARRRSNRRLLIGVVALALGIAVLVVSFVGLGRTVGALARLAPAAGEQLASEPPAAQLAARGVPIATNAPEQSSLDSSALSQPRANAAARPNTSQGAAETAIATPALGGTPGLGGSGGVSGMGGVAGIGGVAGMGGAAGTGGGAGAAPVGVACGAATCSADQRCCNASCGICTSPGENCPQQLCGVANVAASVMCGPNTCNVGQVCCNASCGICTAPGASCSQRTCSNDARAPTSVMCGAAQCNDGQVCCNPSCGTCVAPGQSCSHDVCQ